MLDDKRFQQQLIKRWEKGLTFTYYHPKKSQTESIFLRLSQINHLVMVGKTSTKKMYFNLEKVQTDKFSFEKQTKYKLPHHQYLILREPFEEEVILLFPTAKLRNFMEQQFKQLLQILEEQSNLSDPVAIKLFLAADENQSMGLSVGEVRLISKLIKTEFDNEIDELIKFINFRNKQSQEELSVKNFLLLTQLFGSRKQMIHLYERYSREKIEKYEDYLNKSMHKNEFRSFLIQKQHEDRRVADKIVESVLEEQQYINFVTFSAYLMSPNNQVLDPHYINQHIQKNHPLTSYYCYSSHNTYLTGNQLTSDSKAQRYLQDLEHGLRCVQIDVHDGDHGPIVKHGYTATASVNFSQVIKSIAEFCEENQNHTPIVLSVENHCNTTNQYEMAQIMEHQLGERILRVKNYPGYKAFPTLEECMGKVIIKGSGSFDGYMENLKKENMIKKKNSIESPLQDPEKEFKVIEIQEVPQEFKSMKKNFEDRVSILTKEKQKFNQTIQCFENFVEDHRSNLTVSIKKKKINSKMLMVTSMLSAGKMGQPCPWQSLSINESKLAKYFDKDKQKVKNHTNIGWVRSYPDGTRFDSSNYNPFTALEMGVQIIALNTQNVDYYTICMKKLFLRNSHHVKGYRLKQRKESKGLTQISIMPISCVRIRHESSVQIPKIQIKMCLMGESADMKLNSNLKKMKPYTQVIEGNAFNPIFSKPKIMTVKSKTPQSSFILIEVQNCGFAALPVSHTKKGYRAAKLFNKNYQFNGSKVLCWIQ